MLKTLDPFATITRAETFTELQALGVEKVSAEYGLKDADGWWAAVEHGGVFEASSFSVELEHHYILLLLARGGTVHYPLDPRLKRADVSGAINAFANSANTGWLFSHTNAGPHQDFLLALQAAVTGMFAPAIDAALVKRVMATNPAIIRKAQDSYDSLVKYRKAVLDAAIAGSRGVALGHYHKDVHPTEGHVHKHVREALANVKLAWAVPAMRADWLRVATIASGFSTAMASPHTPVTRIEKLEAAKKQEAAEEENEE